jgi:NAD(P)-dependent dehydrogenase (short-subunit alcohol dehydrogenase family)
MDLKLQGKRALVTGSSSGIGASIAELLAEEGVKVVVHGRNTERAEAVANQIRKNGGEAAIAIGDLSNNEGAAAAAKAALSHWNGIDILVNNAGGPSNGELTWDNITAEDMLKTYELNAVSTFRMIMACMPGMKERGWGRIIQMSSVAGTAPFGPGIPDYGAAKAAVLTLTVNLAKYLSNTGITVNAVSPGLVVTPILQGYLEALPSSIGKNWDEIQAEAALNWHVPVGKLATPADIASTVVFLASPLSANINASNVRTDGGIVGSII